MRLTLAVMLLLALFAGPARAEGDRKQARELYEQGTALYNVGEYKSALEKFKAAYLVIRDPVFLFNIGQCQRQLDDPTGAAASYKAYRREQPDAPNRVEVDRLIQEMEKAAKANTERRNQPPVDVLRPGPTTTSPSTTAPTAAPSTTAPTSPSSTASTSTDAATLTAHPADRRPVYKKAWFWGVVGGVVVVAAVGVTLGVVLGARNDSSTLLPDARY